MEKWFNKIILETENVLLRPLTIEDKNDLVEASKDGDLSELWFTTVPTEETVEKYINAALEEHNADKGLPFVVIDKKANKIIGTTRYMNGVPEYRKLEIGHTWYAKSYQKTYVNTECKFLLLTHAFEVLKAIAVEFRTNWYNLPSRNAIARLGAKQDGVLRNNMISANGLVRDTVVFSIIENEWPTCKVALTYKIDQLWKRNNLGN